MSSCVKPTTAFLNPTDTTQELPFTDGDGRPVGTVLVPASAIEPGEVLVVGPPSEAAENAAQSLEVGSEIVQVTLTDIFGESTQPSDDIEICLEVSDPDRAEEDGCLSFFDEERDVWVCEDPCLDLDDNLACGSTDHFTKYVYTALQKTRRLSLSLSRLLFSLSLSLSGPLFASLALGT